MSNDWTDGVIHDVEIRPLKRYADSRGWLCELFRSDELGADIFPAMCYVSETQPGVTRGPHEHVDQTDFFAFFGPGELKLYLWDHRQDSPSKGVKMVVPVGASNPTAVVVPPGVVHAYKSVSEIPALVFNAPNRLYAGEKRKRPVDEIRHEELENSPFIID